MITQNSSVRVPVYLKTSLGANATGIVPANILNGIVEITKADGSTVSITLVGSGMGQNWFEIDSVQSPGLYHILLPTTATSILGPIQYTINPAATQFISVAYFETVTSNLTSIYQFLFGNQKIDQTNSRLIIYQSDGITPLVQYYLTDENAQPSIYNIRNKVQVT